MNFDRQIALQSCWIMVWVEISYRCRVQYERTEKYFGYL